MWELSFSGILDENSQYRHTACAPGSSQSLKSSL
jgi:hypothetical protein